MAARVVGVSKAAINDDKERSGFKITKWALNVNGAGGTAMVVSPRCVAKACPGSNESVLFAGADGSKLGPGSSPG